MSETKTANAGNLKINRRPLGTITPYPGNPRINDPAVPSIIQSLREFGFRQPIVVDPEGVIIVGHARYKAAVEMGLESVPVHVAADLSPEQVKAYRLADNQTATLSDWDLNMLAVELTDLQGADYDLDLLGFSEDELANLFRPVASDLPPGDPDAIPAPPSEAITKRGDVWLLGDHRLMCGDSSVAADIDLLLAGAKIQLVHMDPPYNVKVEPRSNNAIASGLASGRGGKHHQQLDVARNPGKSKPTDAKMRPKDRPLENDFLSPQKFHRLLLGWFGNVSRVLEPGRSFYIWGGYVNCGNYPQPLKICGLYFSQAIIWVKDNPVLTRKDFMGDHEWCFYGWKEGAAHQFLGPQNVTDVWRVKKVSSQNMVHLTEKPTELAWRAMEYSSKPGENVLDMFGGSGSTLIAAEQSERKAYLMEIDPLYCDVIVDRWETFTGKKAQREAAA